MTDFIDIHHHFLPGFYRDALEAAGQSAPNGISGRPDRTEPDATRTLDRLGIRTAYLSLSSPGVHFGDDQAACDFARRCKGGGGPVGQGSSWALRLLLGDSVAGCRGRAGRNLSRRRHPQCQRRSASGTIIAFHQWLNPGEKQKPWQRGYCRALRLKVLLKNRATVTGQTAVTTSEVRHYRHERRGQVDGKQSMPKSVSTGAGRAVYHSSYVSSAEGRDGSVIHL